MAIRRPAPIGKRPASRPGVLGVGAGFFDASSTPATEAAGNDQGAANEAARDKFMKQLHVQLVEQRSLDNSEIDLIMEHFRAAVAEVSLKPITSELDMSSWISVLEDVASAESAAPDEADHLALLRQIFQLKTSLQEPGLQTALEYMQRLEADGEEEASAWLAGRRAEQGDAEVATQANDKDAAGLMLQQSITQSRSRRLRGPPAR